MKRTTKYPKSFIAGVLDAFDLVMAGLLVGIGIGLSVALLRAIAIL